MGKRGYDDHSAECRVTSREALSANMLPLAIANSPSHHLVPPLLTPETPPTRCRLSPVCVPISCTYTTTRAPTLPPRQPAPAVVTTEFGSQPRSYWVRALASGAVRVNNTLTAPDYRFKGGDLFTHKTHRHEPPGTAVSDTVHCNL
jgi:hypothetical protein